MIKKISGHSDPASDGFRILNISLDADFHQHDDEFLGNENCI